jgi:hypothetical protein
MTVSTATAMAVAATGDVAKWIGHIARRYSTEKTTAVEERRGYPGSLMFARVRRLPRLRPHGHISAS